MMEWSDDMLVDGFPLCMRDMVEDWYSDLPLDVKATSWRKLKRTMLCRFGRDYESKMDDAQEELSTPVLQE